MTSEQRNQSIERAVSILNAFSMERPELRVSDIAAYVGLGVSTTSRMLATLESLGFVERDAASQLYRLGEGLLSRAAVVLNRDHVYRQARPVAQRLAGETGLGVNAAVRRGAELMYLLNFEGPLAAKSFTMLGQTSPLHATGMGKCLLLDIPPEQRRALLPGEGLQAFTQHTLTSHEALDAELDRCRERGYATEREELAFGRGCVAAPVVGPAGEVVAALSLSGPLSALAIQEREQELARIVVEAADLVSSGLGYLGPQPRVLAADRR